MALIVVADDEVLLAELLADLLADAGHEVVTAMHGRQALKVIQERHPDLLITDFMMPLMTGLELAEAIRGDREIAGTPIVLVSGAQGMIARLRLDLFNEVIDKPYDVRLLLDIVERLTGQAGQAS